MPKLTIADLRAGKGVRQLSVVAVDTADEARACAEAGVDQIVGYEQILTDIRAAAPDTFVTCAIFGEHAASDADAIRGGLRALEAGADAVYTGMSMARVAAMAHEHIPVVGHAGLVPYRSSWFGGLRAVGKNAAEAVEVYEDVVAYEQAGAIAVEMEVVPERVATEISRRVSITVISMGSGAGCDGQYLFASDILGLTQGRMPRHARQYADLAAEEARLQRLRVDAFGRYLSDVSTGAFPDPGRTVTLDDAEYAAFVERLPPTVDRR